MSYKPYINHILNIEKDSFFQNITWTDVILYFFYFVVAQNSFLIQWVDSNGEPNQGCLELVPL